MTGGALAVAGGGFWLLGCSAGLLLLMGRSRKMARAVSGRIDRALGPYRTAEAGSRGGRGGLRTAGLVHRMVGYQPSRGWRYALSFRRVVLLSLLPAAMVGLLLSHLLGAIGDLAGPPVWLLAARWYFHRADRRHAAKLFGQFPDALGTIVRAVRVGVPVGSAIAIVGREAASPTREEFRDVAEAVGIGRPLGEALVQMAERSAVTEYRFFATALALQARAGGSLTETLETLADTIRKRVAARQRGHALASEARTSCYVIAALPFVVAGAMSVTNPGYMDVLLTTSIGNWLLAVAVGSLGTGLYVMGWISKRTLG